MTDRYRKLKDGSYEVAYEGCCLLNERTFRLPRYRPDLFEDAKRLSAQEPLNAVETIQACYRLFAESGISTADWPAFVSWGRKAWVFMPPPEPVGNYAHAMTKDQATKYQWFNKGSP